MNLWRLEWLRLTRTHRLLALVGVFAFFGLSSPPLARYRDQLIDLIGGGITITAPPATPVDGLTNYVSNSAQIGLLVFVLVAATSLAFDANRESAIFLRTRVRHPRDLVLVKYAVNVGVAALAFDFGTLCAWYGSVVLLGPLPGAGVVAGMLLTNLYLAFVGAIVAALAAKSTSVVGTAIGALVIALGLGLVGSIGHLGDWLPSHLVGSLTDLGAGGSVGDYLRAAAVTVLATVGLVALAASASASREL